MISLVGLTPQCNQASKNTFEYWQKRSKVGSSMTGSNAMDFIQVQELGLDETKNMFIFMGTGDMAANVHIRMLGTCNQNYSGRLGALQLSEMQIPDKDNPLLGLAEDKASEDF